LFSIHVHDIVSVNSATRLTPMTNAEALNATIEIRKQKGFWADLRIMNNGEKPIFIHNPGNYQQTEKWEFSREAYIVAVLLSFHFLEMKLFTPDGTLVACNPIATLADHIVHLPLELKPGTELRIISIPLHEFYDLKSLSNYSLELTYGDNNLKVYAKNQFQYP
jgi:hypothetical protein